MDSITIAILSPVPMKILSSRLTKFVRQKERLKGKTCFRTPPDSWKPRRDTEGWWATVWSTSTNFKLQIVILKQNQIFKISYVLKFYSSFEKNSLSPKIAKTFTKQPKMWICGMGREILDCLKCTVNEIFTYPAKLRPLWLSYVESPLSLRWS